MRLLLITLTGLTLALVVAAGQEPLRLALLAFFGLLQRPFTALGEALRAAARWLAARIGEAFRDEAGNDASSPRHWRGWHVVGALLYLAAFVTFTVAEFWLAVLTLGPLFGLETPAAPASAEMLTGVALLGGGFFWGMALLDVLGITPLGPWDRLQGRGRQVLIVISVLMVALALAIGAVLGYWRLRQALQPALDEGPEQPGIELRGSPLREVPQGVQTPAALPAGYGEDAQDEPSRIFTLLVGGGLPALVTASAVGSGWGVAASLRYLWALALGLAVVPLGVLATLLELGASLVNLVFTVVENVLAFLGRIGSTFWNWTVRFPWVQRTLKFRPLGTAPDPAASGNVQHGTGPSSTPDGGPPADTIDPIHDGPGIANGGLDW